jgi:hypothetical protein
MHDHELLQGILAAVARIQGAIQYLATKEDVTSLKSDCGEMINQHVALYHKNSLAPASKREAVKWSGIGGAVGIAAWVILRLCGVL